MTDRPDAPTSPMNANGQSLAAITGSTFSCAVCGAVCNSPPSQLSKRKTCSYQCAAELRWGKAPALKCCNCGKSFFAKRRSESPKTCSSQCLSEYMSRRKRELGQGWGWKAREAARAACAKPGYSDKLSQSLKGMVHSTARTRKHSKQHHRASVYFVKSPRNVIYLVMNTVAFVSENEHLFPPETVKWKERRTGRCGSIGCAAVHGLNRLNRGERGVWRGWMKVSNSEGKEAVDYLPRTFIESNS